MNTARRSAQTSQTRDRFFWARTLLGRGLFLGLLSLAACGADDNARADIAGGGVAGSGDSGAGGGDPGPTGPCKGVPTTGRCLGTSAIESCLAVGHADVAPRVVQVDCAAGEVCKVEGNVAGCAPAAGCVEGSKECVDALTIRSCQNGTWLETTCAACASGVLGVDCLQQAPTSTGIFVSGQVSYEALRPKLDHGGFDPIPVDLPAVGAFVGVAVGAPDYDAWIGSGVVDKTGAFRFELSETPSADAAIVVFPLEFSSNGDLALTLLIPESSELLYQRTRDAWSWGWELCALPGECAQKEIIAGSLDVVLNDGAGALHIFSMLHRGLIRLKALFPGVAQPTLAVFWDDETEWSCGDCYLGRNFGGASYPISPTQTERWDVSILLSGGLLRPSHWSDSVIGHELGHYAMESYSLGPKEGGTHSFSGLSTAGFAYREGFATFFGQTVASIGGAPNPRYLWQENGKPHLLDLAAFTLDSVPLAKPNPTGPVDQQLSEASVAAILWSLWAPSDAVAPQGLGDAALTDIRAQRLLFGPDRGYFDVDLVDYLDAVFCTDPARASAVTKAANTMNYPWRKADATCSP